VVETQVKFVVVGHHDRYASALLLASELGAHLLWMKASMEPTGIIAAPLNGQTANHAVLLY
jgi:hypothetical protein